DTCFPSTSALVSVLRRKRSRRWPSGEKVSRAPLTSPPIGTPPANPTDGVTESTSLPLSVSSTLLALPPKRGCRSQPIRRPAGLKAILGLLGAAEVREAVFRVRMRFPVAVSYSAIELYAPGPFKTATREPSGLQSAAPGAEASSNALGKG